MGLHEKNLEELHEANHAVDFIYESSK